jgi:hypothetical protein
VDVALYFSVLWRFRLLVALGVIAASALAIFAAAKIELDGSVPKFTTRGTNVWESRSTLLVTQEGFPWGRSTLNELVPVSDDQKQQQPGGFAPRFADPGRYSSLALLYARLAGSDDVRRRMLRDGPIDGEFAAEATRSSDGSAYLPLIEIIAQAETPDEAKQLAARATEAFRTYLDEQQVVNEIPPAERVQVPVLTAPAKPILVQGPSIVRPIFLFLAVLAVVVGIAFLLENLRPRPAAASVRSPSFRDEADVATTGRHLDSTPAA